MRVLQYTQYCVVDCKTGKAWSETSHEVDIDTRSYWPAQVQMKDALKAASRIPERHMTCMQHTLSEL